MPPSYHRNRGGRCSYSQSLQRTRNLKKGRRSRCQGGTSDKYPSSLLNAFSCFTSMLLRVLLWLICNDWGSTCLCLCRVLRNCFLKSLDWILWNVWWWSLCLFRTAKRKHRRPSRFVVCQLAILFSGENNTLKGKDWLVNNRQEFEKVLVVALLKRALVSGVDNRGKGGANVSTVKALREKGNRLALDNMDTPTRTPFSPSAQPPTPPPEEDLLGTWIQVGKPHKVECQMKWIESMLPSIVSQLAVERFYRIIVKDLGEFVEEFNRVVITPSKLVNVPLMLASFHAYLGEFERALSWIREAVGNMKKLTSEKDQHIRAYEYLIQANFHTINAMIKSKSATGAGDGNLFSPLPPKVLEFLSKLYDDTEDIFQAAMVASRGILARQMRCWDTELDCLRKATRLDPKHAEWHRILYVALRRRRRELRSRSAPEPEEKKAIVDSYALDSNSCLTQCFYAGMLDEGMVARKDLLMEERKEQIADEVVDLMLKALEKNPEEIWTNVRLAEIYSYGNYPHLDPKHGEILFQDCEERWPDSSMVLHKFGKYYSKKGSPLKALDYYAKGLEADSGNFPCLMDYLKSMQHMKIEQEHMLAAVNKSLSENIFSQVPHTKILIAKGILLWNAAKDDTEKGSACDAWIDAAMKSHGSRYTTAATLVKGYYDVTGEFKLNINELVDFLNGLLQVSTDDKRKRAIKELINEITCTRHNRSVRKPEQVSSPRYRSNSLSSYPSTTSLSSVTSWGTAQTSLSADSLADSETNWRERSPPTGIFAAYEPQENFSYYYGGPAAGPRPWDRGNTDAIPSPRNQNPDRRAQWRPSDTDDNWRRKV